MKFVGSKQRQRGATFLGIVIIGGILLFALYGGMRLVPIYKEYMDISKALTQTASALGANASIGEIRLMLERRWVVNNISTIYSRDVEVNRVASVITLRAKYRAEAEFLGNVKLVVDFDKSVNMGSAAAP